MYRKFVIGFLGLFAGFVQASDNAVGGKITSLMGDANNPAIRIGGNLSPNKCDGGPYGWLYFQGTPQEKQWLYSTALAMALSGNSVSVYTNSDGAKCEIHNIQILVIK